MLYSWYIAMLFLIGIFLLLYFCLEIIAFSPRNRAHIGTVLRHKYWVFKYGRQCGVGVWQLLLHDLSKLGLTEFGPYARHFFLYYGANREHSTEDTAEWQGAWLHHQKYNKHHWQAWIVLNARDYQGIRYQPQPMPEKYAREMVADWMAAGKAYNGSMQVAKWWLVNKGLIVLHPDTHRFVNELISHIDHSVLGDSNEP